MLFNLCSYKHLHLKKTLSVMTIIICLFQEMGCSSKPAEGEQIDSEVSSADAPLESNSDSATGKDQAQTDSGSVDLEKEFSESSASTDSPGDSNSSSGQGNEWADQSQASNNQSSNNQESLTLEPQAPGGMDNTTNQDSGSSTMSEPSGGSLGGGSNKVVGMKYQANEAGGTLVIELDGTPQFTTRTNAETNQMVIEIANTKIPKKYKRNLNTKDMAGSIGAVDAYQNGGSTTARVVVQLRQGFPEPTVQQEGNSILVMANGGASESGASSNQSNGSDQGEQGNIAEENGGGLENAGGTESVEEPVAEGPVLQSHKLSEYLGNNTKFYGKKISLETNDMDIREALKFIMLESGVNMVIAEEVQGKVSLKLRQVPWDQALVMVMRARKLGYTRTGNVLRIAPLTDLKQEEDDATKLALSNKSVEALKVRMFPVNYSKVEDLEKKVREFLSDRGKVVADLRTNYLVVSDISENMNRIVKLIASLDIQPSQVLIEGRIVEAKDSFKRAIGFTWGATGQSMSLGKNLNMSPQLEVNPLVTRLRNDTTGIGSFGLNLGVLDFLGQLDATLILAERDETVKVISSPRIVTMSNEKANINEKTQIPIKQTTISGTNTQTTYVFKDLNLKLEVTPQITSDGAVIMALDVMREVQGAAINIADQMPSINSRQATTKVLVKNGQTAIIGGIYQNDVTELSEGVPYLKDLPGLGFLFRNKVTTREKQELLVFLTPRILSQVDAQNLPNPNGGN